MFDIGWTEMLVIAVVMIVVVGPKDLPRMLRTFGKTTAKLRTMAGDFQKQFNEALKEAELDDVKKSVDELRSLNPTAEIKKQLNPFEKAASDVRAGLDAAMKPKPSTAAEPASDAVHAAEPLKNGATTMPGVAGPEAMPTAAPVFPAPTQEPAPVAKPAKSAPASKPAKAAAAPKAAVKAPAAAKPAAKAAAPKAASKVAAEQPAAKPAAAKPAKAPAKSPAKPATTKKKPAGTAK
ncbi:Sec-independent protein translocase protein TatB [Mesorhizobium sp. YR577]|uniref:Sec-independent protein translocase protein TatB n=1 Tax=Mesorhizobium sp. YR577 TaxID=1884373 RepID=UPI0008ECBA28|nr:Sec-independent protein translocase protein TatB [Mesorhizobium sp. YR577]SFT70928.1 sec-independent protein translocase protein TatB [Mesorhizobium sp. YR577]